jgi:uncharacterized membrane protein YbhN (UPF0104 family)
VADVNHLLQNMFLAVFLLVWVGGISVLGFRARAKSREYIRRLPPVNGVKLVYPYWAENMFSSSAYELKRAFRQRQSDSELEHLRQEAWQRTFTCFIWLVGVPPAFLVVWVLVILIGHLL